MAWPLLSWILSSSSSSSSSDSSSYEYDDGDISFEEEGDNHDPEINENNIDHDHPHNDDVSFEATSKSNNSNSNSTSDYTYTLSTDEPTPKRRRLDKPNQALTVQDDENKCSEFESQRRVRGRKRVWTKEDELDLLQGFLDYSTRRTASFHHNPKETASFYDQVGPKLKAQFNKSQLVQKLRRLKRKYHNVAHRMNNPAAPAGNKKDCFRFKSPHDKDIFELSLKIWGSSTSGTRDPLSTFQDDQKPRLNNDGTTSLNVGDVLDGVIIGLPMNPMPLSSSPNLGGGGGEEVVDEKWREQQILELEAYSKRLELVQHQVKAVLEELRSRGNQ